MKATIKLFKALPVRTKAKKLPTKELLEATIKRGFVFSPEVIANYFDYNELIRLVEEVFGITGEKANASFHKSWKKVKDTDMEQLIVEQVAHYLTTYGKRDPEGYLREKDQQGWGVSNLSDKILDLPDLELEKLYDVDYVYIPKEILTIPGLDVDELKLIVIKGYTRLELKEKLLKLLDSGIALKEDTIDDVVDVSLFVEIDEKDIGKIKNKEVKVILYEYLNLFPVSPVEFLRYIVYVATDETLLIKSKQLIDKIKEKKNVKVAKLIKDYSKKYGLETLAETFYRFKPIWLAFRTNQELKSTINKMRKMAVECHVPMPEDYLNSVTANIKKGHRTILDRVEKELKKVNVFRKIRLAYALKYRTKDVDSILFRIRNGKAYATDFHFSNKATAQAVLDVVLASIAEDVEKNVKGKNIYIPDYINYSLPATEKQFTGNFPAGTYISIPKDMIVGVHWENVGFSRIDLDLSMISSGVGKIGWDSYYRTDDGSILFSGDITDAPKPLGATELFYVRRQGEDNLIILLNYYNYDETVKVPFKIIVAKETILGGNFRSNHMVNPNKIIAVVQSEISQKQKILGLLKTTLTGSKFYFVETSIGKAITSSGTKFVGHSRKYLANFYQNSIELKDILVRAGANVTHEKLDSKREFFCDIDLSPENLEKDSILNLLIK